MCRKDFVSSYITIGCATKNKALLLYVLMKTCCVLLLFSIKTNKLKKKLDV